MALHNPHIQVTVVDRDEKRIRRWNSKHPPIYEPGLNDILRIARDGSRACVFANGPAEQESTNAACEETAAHVLTSVGARQPNLVFTTDLPRSVREADVVLIAVNTPTKTRGNGAGSATDMAAFEAVTALIAQHAKPGAIIVEKSTVPCRTAQLVQDTVSQPFPQRRETQSKKTSSPSTGQACPSKSSATPNSWPPVPPSTTSSTPTAS
jgi:UDPglucose 6-dehydrogenase